MGVSMRTASAVVVLVGLVWSAPASAQRDARQATPGAAYASTIEDADGEWWRVEVEPGVRFVFMTGRDAATGADPAITLYAADGLTELGSDDDGGSGLGSRLEYTSAGEATLLLHVRDVASGTTGRYSLSVCPAAAQDSAAAATNVTGGSENRGCVTTAGSTQWWRLEAQAGLQYEVGLTPGSLEYPELLVLEADGMAPPPFSVDYALSNSGGLGSAGFVSLEDQAVALRVTTDADTLGTYGLSIRVAGRISPERLESLQRIERAWELLDVGFARQALESAEMAASQYGPYDKAFLGASRVASIVEARGNASLETLGRMLLLTQSMPPLLAPSLPFGTGAGDNGAYRVTLVPPGIDWDGRPLEVGDIVTSVDDVVPGNGRVSALAESLGAGAEVEVNILRDGRRFDTKVDTVMAVDQDAAVDRFFRLRDFGALAYFAGHPAITTQVAEAMRRTVESHPEWGNPGLANLYSALLEATVMAGEGDLDEAYEHLLDSGDGVDGSYVSFVQSMPGAFWPLFADPRRMAFLMDLEPADLPDVTPGGLPQPFPDLNGDLVQPVRSAAPPSLNDSPRGPAPPQPAVDQDDVRIVN